MDSSQFEALGPCMDLERGRGGREEGRKGGREEGRKGRWGYKSLRSGELSSA